MNETQRCSNCGQDIPVASVTLHQVHCARNTQSCDVCGDRMPYKLLEAHKQEEHSIVPCPHCKKKMENRLLEKHVDQCAEAPQKCPYCDLEQPRRVLAQEHIDFCGSRTDECEECGKRVMFKFMQKHLASEHTPTASDISKGSPTKNGSEQFLRGDPAPSLARQPAPSLARQPAPSLAKQPAPSLAKQPAPSFTRQPAPSFARQPQYEVQGASFPREDEHSNGKTPAQETAARSSPEPSAADTDDWLDSLTAAGITMDEIYHNAREGFLEDRTRKLEPTDDDSEGSDDFIDGLLNAGVPPEEIQTNMAHRWKQYQQRQKEATSSEEEEEDVARPPSPMPEPAPIEVNIPCEFCGDPVPWRRYILHASGCQSKSERTIKDEVQCEYCKFGFSASALAYHQKVCQSLKREETRARKAVEVIERTNKRYSGDFTMDDISAADDMQFCFMCSKSIPPNQFRDHERNCTGEEKSVGAEAASVEFEDYGDYIYEEKPCQYCSESYPLALIFEHEVQCDQKPATQERLPSALKKPETQERLPSAMKKPETQERLPSAMKKPQSKGFEESSRSPVKVKKPQVRFVVPDHPVESTRGSVPKFDFSHQKEDDREDSHKQNGDSSLERLNGASQQEEPPIPSVRDISAQIQEVIQRYLNSSLHHKLESSSPEDEKPASYIRTMKDSELVVTLDRNSLVDALEKEEKQRFFAQKSKAEYLKSLENTHSVCSDSDTKAMKEAIERLGIEVNEPDSDVRPQNIKKHPFNVDR